MKTLSEYKEISSFERLRDYRTFSKLDVDLNITVLVSNYNANKTIDLALNSLLNQTVKSITIQIIDDGSFNDLNVPYSIVYLKNHMNQGAYCARNYGLKNASGDFITVHDADDWSHPQKLELQAKALMDNPNAMASVSHWARCTNDMQFETRPDGTVVHRNVSSLMIRREVFEKLGYWDRVSVNADTEYYYRILAAYGPDSIVEVLPGVPLALGRRHPGSLTMQPETHWKTQFGGVRKDYMDAAHAWHKECAKTGNWYMPYVPEQRPFPVPPAIDRSVIELGDRVWPHIRGAQDSGVRDPGKPLRQAASKCILLCGHAAGEQGFGAERSLLDLARAIDGLGYRLVVTLPERNAAYLERLKPYCSDIVLLPSPWRRDEEVWPIALAAFEALMIRFAVDLVHVNTVVHRTPLLAAEKLGISRVLHVRELLNWDRSLLSAMGEQCPVTAVLQSADRLLANSHYTAKALCPVAEDGAKDLAEKVRVVTNTVSLESSYQPKRFAVGEVIRVGMISSNLPKKGLADFVTIASKARERKLPIHFYLIGPQNEHTNTLQTSCSENLTLLDYCDTPDMALVHLDVVLNLSEFQESFGRTIAEAMLAAKPVIAYRWGALPELVEHGVNGFLVHIGDTDGVVKWLNYLSRRPERMFTLGQQGQKMACTRFSPGRFQAELASAYQGLI